ncbi:MAG: dephospho-CoA kinase [Pseudomonadota bacterium]
MPQDDPPAQKRVLAIVGMAGSGKSCIAEAALVRDWPVVYFGGQVLAYLAGQGIDINPENERKAREELREKLGMGAMAILTAENIDKEFQNQPLIVIDGLYSYAEYEELTKRYQVTLVAVVAPRALRHQRLGVRKDRPLDANQAKDRDFAELQQLQKGWPIALADHYLLNDQDRATFDTHIAQLFDHFS